MVSIQQALKQFSNDPQKWERPIEAPVHYLVAHTLFDIALHPNAKVKRTIQDARRAQKIILDRLGGNRTPGTSPRGNGAQHVKMLDLTAGFTTSEGETFDPRTGDAEVPTDSAEGTPNQS